MSTFRLLAFSAISLFLITGCQDSFDLNKNKPLPDVSNSSIVGTDTILANGTATSLITIVLKDAQDLPVSGTVPTFAATNTDSKNNYGTCSASNLSGISTCSLSSTKAESKIISLTSPISKSGNSVTFIAGPASATKSSITGVGPTLADGIASSIITITIMDAFENAIAGQTPTFSATDWEATNVYGACSVSNANGISTCFLSSSEGETKVLSILTPVLKVGSSVVFNEVDNCTGNTGNAPFAIGDGSAGAPYGICTAAQLNNIGTNAAHINKNFKLYANLDLSSYTANSFSVIATSASPFVGTFNGNRKVISNFTYSDSTATGDFLGLFRKIGSAGIVKNLGMEGANVTGRSYVGILAGENVGIVDNCYAKGTVSGATRIGGLLGRFWETSAATYVKDSYAEATVSGTGFVGGLVGWVRGTVTGSHAIGTVSSGGDRIGGLVGTVDQGTIINSYAQGSVSGNQLVGGLIGTIGGSISGSHAISTITCGPYCGGITGNIGQGSGSGSIQKSYANSTITSSSYVVGGIVGYGYANYNIQNCYANISISSSSGWLGGIAGWTGGTITNSYAIPTAIGVGGVDERGGISGDVGGAIIGSFWNHELDASIVYTDGLPNSDVTGASSASVMKTAATYTGAGWDTNIWNIQDGSYPTLK